MQGEGDWCIGMQVQVQCFEIEFVLVGLLFQFQFQLDYIVVGFVDIGFGVVDVYWQQIYGLGVVVFVLDFGVVDWCGVYVCVVFQLLVLLQYVDFGFKFQYCQ